MLTSWLQSFRRGCGLSPRLFSSRPNLAHRRQRNLRRRSRWEGLAAAGVEKLEERVLLTPPVFSQASYSISVSEGELWPNQIGTVGVSDADMGNTHTFSIIGGNEHGRFEIVKSHQHSNGAVGSIRLINPLDYERQAEYQLTVQVQDSTGLTDTADVTVNLTDVAEAGQGDPLYHGNADADATGESPVAVTDGPLSVNQLTGDVVVASGSGLGVGEEGVLPVYQSGTLGRPIVNLDVPLQSGNLPTRIDATLTFGGTQQQTVQYSVDSALDGQQIRLALEADATSLGTGHYDWSAQVTLVYSGSSTNQNFSGKREIINETNSPIGAGWRIAELDKLVFKTNQSGMRLGATLARGDGTAGYFELLMGGPGGGSYRAAAGSLAKLVDNGNGTLSLLRQQGGEDVFNSTSGLLTKRRDVHGNETAFSYVDGDGDSQAREISQILRPFGRSVDYAWVGNKLDSVTTPAAGSTGSRGRPAGRSKRSPGRIRTAIQTAASRPDRSGWPTTAPPAC